MKKLLTLFLCLSTVAIMGKAQTSLYDFSAVNDEGVTLYYKITNEINQEVNWSYKGSSKTDYDETFTKIIVPDKVKDSGGKEYRVTGVEQGVFYPDVEELTLPKTLKKLGWQTCIRLDKMKKFTLQALEECQGIIFHFGSSTGVVGGHELDEIRIMLTTLPVNTFMYPYPVFNMDLYTTKVYVPTDYSVIYKTTEDWKTNAGNGPSDVPYLEEVKIGPHGYTSYYLENENFEVPTGCTAYIVKGASLAGGVGNATVQAFAAGSIIPKQTGFILGGTANTTVAYRAHVTGSEVDVSGNLLVGTATENEFSGAGYKYYIFGNGSQGQGFYHQGTRDGNSIKVGAHHAGLRLPTSGYAPAKQLVFDFEEARRNATTGISTISSNTADGNTVYDLQGRRVQNPVKGIYIMNGKKIIFKK